MMLSECVIFQSVVQSGKPFQQIANLMLQGLSTRDDTMNTDSGTLYGSFTKSGSTYTLNLYKDILKSELVATAASSTLAVATVTAANESQLSGTVNFTQYLQDDLAIQVTCFLSKDSDLPMDNLETLRDYDQTNGFAAFHLNAFKYLTREFIVSRYKSKVWNRDFIDSSQINGGVGGYDLSKCLNLWVLREASAHYAFSRIAEKQAIESGGMFERRSKESKVILRAHLESIELTFDENNDRVEDASRSLATWKISRA